PLVWTRTSSMNPWTWSARGAQKWSPRLEQVRSSWVHPQTGSFLGEVPRRGLFVVTLIAPHGQLRAVRGVQPESGAHLDHHVSGVPPDLPPRVLGCHPAVPLHDLAVCVQSGSRPAV